VRIDVRKVGIWLVVAGGTAAVVGMVTDAVRHADDPSLNAKEGIFNLSGVANVLFFGGIGLAIVGVLAMLFGRELYGAATPSTVGRRLLQVGAPLAAVILIAGCAGIAGGSVLGDPAPPGTDHHGETTTADGAGATTATGPHDESGHDESGHDESGHDESGAGAAASASGAHDESGHGTVIPGTATGDSPCEIASPTPASPGQVGAGGGGGAEDPAGEHGARGMVVQTPLTRADRVTLEQQMAQARAVALKYPTVKDAEAAGYRMSTPYVPCIGAHYTNTALVVKFDPAAPSELLYDGTKPDSKMVGLSYLVYHRGGPPDGFAGANDHWHQHNANGGLCFGKGGTVIGGEEQTRADCEARGGQKRELTDIWMAHAWVVPGFECSWGVFAGECPELGGKTGGTAWD
jgi:hypothetical protein